MSEKPLYQDEHIKIERYPTDILPNLYKLSITSGCITGEHSIPRALLLEFARTPRGQLEEKILSYGSGSYRLILWDLEEIGVDRFHTAIRRACGEEIEGTQARSRV